MSDKVYVGIDPGKDGAIATLYPDSDFRTISMPTWVIKTRKTKGGKVVDVVETDPVVLMKLLAGLVEDVGEGEGPVQFYLEQTQPYYKGGGAAMYNFGRNVMAVESVLLCQRYSYQMVIPQVWMKACGLPRKKDSSDKPSVPYVMKKYPDLCREGYTNEQWRGICDALCIAEYGRSLG